MILVTSAGGKSGRAIIKAFIAADQSVRALVRREDAAAELREFGATETVIADLSDRAALTSAMDGVDAVYYIAPNMMKDEKIFGDNMIAAAEAAGIDRFVFHSVLHTNVQALAHHWARLSVEEALIESRLDFTILQVSSYMQNMLPGWARMVETGIHAMAYEIDAPMSLVDLDDVAVAALRVVGDDGYAKGIFEIAGPVITLREKAEILTRVLGRDVVAEKLPAETAIEHARHAGVGEFGLESMARMFAHYDKHGLVGSPKTLGWILGRAPIDFETFARRVADA
jgi:NAD(P)H dehydrogenase (quinone)